MVKTHGFPVKIFPNKPTQWEKRWTNCPDSRRFLERRVCCCPDVLPCFCQRTENRARKIRTFLLACVRRSWRGGVGGHVNVPCTSSATCCYAAQRSGSVASLYTWRGGVGGHVNVPCTSSATCCYAAQMSGSVASLYAWRGVGGGAC